MRYISLCASSNDVTSEVASILAKFVGTPTINSTGNKYLKYLKYHWCTIREAAPLYKTYLSLIIFQR